MFTKQIAGGNSMIEVEKEKGKYNVCASCGTEKNLVEVRIRLSRNTNGLVLCFCKDCIRDLHEKAIKEFD